MSIRRRYWKASILVLGALVLFTTVSPDRVIGNGQRVRAETRVSYNANVRQLSDTNFITEVRGKWINYWDGDSWEEINPAIQDEGSEFCVHAAPFDACFPKTAAGTSRMVNRNKFNPTTGQKFDEPPKTQTLVAVGVNDVPGVIENLNIPQLGQVWAVRYAGAYAYGDLLLMVAQGRAPHLEKIIDMPALTTDRNPEFCYDFSEPMTLKRKQSGVDTRWLRRTTFTPDRGAKLKVAFGGVNGFGLFPPKMWDSASSSIKIDYSVSPYGMNGYCLTKHLRVAEAAGMVGHIYTDTVSTFFPDPNTEVRTVDGASCMGNGNDCGVAGESWNTARSGAGEGSDDASATESCSTFGGSGNSNIGINRCHFLYDASGTIPVGATINSATHTVQTDEQQSQDFDSSSFLVMQSSTPASNTAIANGDYDNMVVNSSTELSSRFTLSDGASSTDAVFTLSATSGLTYISDSLSGADGIIKLALREGHDLLNDPVGGVNLTSYIVAKMADSAGTSTDPALVVDWTAAAAVGSDPANSTQILWRGIRKALANTIP